MKRTLAAVSGAFALGVTTKLSANMHTDHIAITDEVPGPDFLAKQIAGLPMAYPVEYKWSTSITEADRSFSEDQLKKAVLSMNKRGVFFGDARLEAAALRKKDRLFAAEYGRIMANTVTGRVNG